MNTATEELINSPFRQRLGAKRRRLVQLLAGLTPTAIVVTVYDEATNTAQPGAQSGAASVTPAGIVTPLLHPGVLGWYRVDVAFKSGDEEYIEYFRLEVY